MKFGNGLTRLEEHLNYYICVCAQL